ncbi:hypothetical protein PoB_000503100 [Plakobranchus ocellatus]|uniref:Uncharacterized protein n=1 Tax=Plakobranchus ocellatus TaxID=259542 RepID=A0AAV3Y5R3_9GAST|nr:hypothetical protein PoB_000503100 [Plakobranchus ocellatus]
MRPLTDDSRSNQENNLPIFDAPSIKHGSRYSWKMEVLSSFLSIKFFNFYTGVMLSLCGVGVFLTGAFSTKWVEIEITSNTVDISYHELERNHKGLAHLGPWRACTYQNHCGQLWVVSPGLGK